LEVRSGLVVVIVSSSNIVSSYKFEVRSGLVVDELVVYGY